jgi:ubiquitin carboxyl-terminal hydrolase 25
LEEKISNL